MGYCSKCGTYITEASGTCASCQSSHGSGTDVPCQRCGMYLPSHELQMWNSRLYCAYCIMDVKDEEKMITERRGHVAEGAEAGVSAEHGKGKESGVCERCGREVPRLYTLSGRNICEFCYSEEFGTPPSPARPSFFGQIVVQAQQILGIRPRVSAKPKPVAKKPEQKATSGRKDARLEFEGKKKD